MIKILLFAGLRDALDQSEIEIEIADRTVGELRAMLVEQYPQAKALIGRSIFAVDQKYVDDQYRFESDRVEVAIVPPVSGG